MLATTHLFWLLFVSSVEFPHWKNTMASTHAAALSLWLVAAGLLISSSLSGVLLWTSITSKTNSGQIYNYVTTHRASTQIVVQILSHVLGAALVLPLTTLINLVTRTTLARKPTCLHQISFYSQLYYQRISFNLPSRFWFMLITFYGMLPNDVLTCTY